MSANTNSTSLAHDEVFRPRKRKWGLILLGSVVFVAIGFLIMDNPHSFLDRFWAYASIIFFGHVAVVALLQFLPGSSFLRVGPDGITVRTMWRTTFCRWSDIERFGVAESSTFHGGVQQQHRMVGFNFSTTYLGRSKAGKLRGFNVRLTGFEAALPDNYGWDYAELAEHLNRLREQYVPSPASTHRSAAG